MYNKTRFLAFQCKLVEVKSSPSLSWAWSTYFLCLNSFPVLLSYHLRNGWEFVSFWIHYSFSIRFIFPFFILWVDSIFENIPFTFCQALAKLGWACIIPSVIQPAIWPPSHIQYDGGCRIHGIVEKKTTQKTRIWLWLDNSN